ncbi:hypothetical protein, partial [Actinocorallia lasiicapitis]
GAVALLLPGDSAPDGGPVVGPTVSASPTASRPRALRLSDLLYAADVPKKDPQHRWSTSAEWTGSLYVPTCGAGTDEEEDPFGRSAGMVVGYNGNPEIGGNELTSTARAEQVMDFPSPESAQEFFAEIKGYAERCPGIKITRPGIGDAALAFTWKTPRSVHPQRSKGVLVRRGPILVIYGDFRNEGPELATLDDHLKDARRMVERLKSLGY